MADKLTDKCLMKFEDGTKAVTQGRIARIVHLLSKHGHIAKMSDRGSITFDHSGSAVKMKITLVFT